MSVNLVERSVRDVLDTVEIPYPFNRAKFVDAIAAARSRPIRLVSKRNLSGSFQGACALWLVFDDEDVVVYRDGTSEYHRDQIVMHEMGHILLGHDKGRQAPEPALMVSSILPALDPSRVKAILNRSSYESEQEDAAELFASLALLAPEERRRRARPFRQAF